MDSILVTGGAGSWGKVFARRVLDGALDVNRLVVYSRDEWKHSEMAEEFAHDPRLRFFIGDVRDPERLRLAMRGVDFVVHAAALKQVPAAEYNPMEVVKTNILGAQNVVTAAMDAGVRRVVALSTDKAVNPVNLYGATKLAAEKVFIASNNLVGSLPTRFCVVRYGNVLGSRGSVIPYFAKLLANGPCELPVTHPEMTRFWMTLDEAASLVLRALNTARGGEIFVPKLPSARIVDIAKALDPDAGLRFVGIRPGEKVHETLIPAEDARHTVDLESEYVILPEICLEWHKNGDFPHVPDGFSYTSGANSRFLEGEELRNALRPWIPNRYRWRFDETDPKDYSMTSVLSR